MEKIAKIFFYVQHSPSAICIYIRIADKAENDEREENFMKKMFVMTMCAAMLSVAAGGAETVYGAAGVPVLARQALVGDTPLVISPGPGQDGSGYIPGMEDPFIDCTTLKKAGSIAGFSMKAPKKIEGYGKRKISAVRNSLIQVVYGSGKNALYIRKAPGDSDISGDYNRYEEQGAVKVKGVRVKLRGAKGKVNTAVWTDSDYSYSVCAQSAISRKQMKKIIEDVIKSDMPDKENEKVQIPSPFIDYSTMDEASAAAGFSLNTPEKIAGYKRELISVISNDMIQVVYQDGEKSLYIRKAAGSGDISGDYNSYEENKTVKIGEVKAEMRGMDGKVSTAVWTEEGFAYSVYAASPVSMEMMKDIIQSVAR